jgi:glycosyl-4,4'-diaponeurosporenoate acyltransferase
MLLGIHFSWTLFLIDVLIYTLMQGIGVWADMVVPQDWFNPERSVYQSWAWEQEGRFYQKYLRIQQWKDKLPSVNSLNGFSKKNLNSLSPEYLRQFIFETCRGEAYHIRSFLATGLFAIWNPPMLFGIIMLISLILNLPFIFIQRYNRPRLKKILAQLESHQSTE